MRPQLKYSLDAGLVGVNAGDSEKIMCVSERADLGRGRVPLAPYFHSAANEWDGLSRRKAWSASIANIFGLMDGFVKLTEDLCTSGFCVTSTEHREVTSAESAQKVWGSDRDRTKAKAQLDWSRASRGTAGGHFTTGMGAFPGKTVPWGMSMGGISVMNLIKAYPDDVAGALIIHGVADLTNGQPFGYKTGTPTPSNPWSFIGNPAIADFVSTANAYRSNGVVPVAAYAGSNPATAGGCSHTGLAAGTLPTTSAHWTSILAEHNPIEFAAALPVKPPILWFVPQDDITCSPAKSAELALAYGPNMSLIVEDEVGVGGHFSDTWYRNYKDVILDFYSDRRAEILAA